MIITKTISLTEEQVDWVEKNFISLSKFVQNAIDVKKEETKNENKKRKRTV